MALFNQQDTMFGAAPQYNPNLNSQVDPATETVEGRVGNLLKTDTLGNYTNPVVRQATERQEQAFNGRGLLNSSMAMQAGQEAAISKAADIAAPDAQTYYNNRRSNVDAQNTFARDQTMFGYDMAKQQDSQGFTSRQDYQKAVQAVSSNYQRMIDTINSSNMTPADKSVAIAQAASVRDGEIAYQNNLYSRMPQWQSEWLATAVPAQGMDLSTVTNRDTLANIANDPAQPQAVRDAALARMQSISGGSAGAPAAGPGSPGSGAPPSVPTDAQGFPTSVEGQAINWDASSGAMTIAKGGPPTLRGEFQQYQAQGGTLSAYDWYRTFKMARSDLNGAGNGTGSASASAGDTGGIGSTSGMSA